MKQSDSIYSPKVSVIVLTYNQGLEKIIKTIDSIVIQEGICFEILICDDGSIIRFEKELTNYFLAKSFSLYRLVFHDKNEGTVSNLFSGLQKAKGKYSKVISPGDCLADKSTLCQWVQYLERNNYEWSFSDVLYYRSEDGKDIFFRTNAHPQLIRPYLKHQNDKCIWNYIALSDIANGASTIGRTSLQLDYCRLLKDRGVIYAEDNMWRLMMFHGIVGSYYPKITICYEYGIGISTSGDPDWGEKLRKDRTAVLKIFSDKKNTSYQQKIIVKAFIKSSGAGKFKKLFIKGRLFLWIKQHFFPRLTKIPEGW